MSCNKTLLTLYPMKRIYFALPNVMDFNQVVGLHSVEVKI